MVLEILNTGTELLLGEVVNTHAAYFGRKLFPLGLRVSRQTTVPDGEAIRESLAEMFPRADVLLVTGGLGPTTDDVTREAVAGLLGLEMREDAAVLEGMKSRLCARGILLRERMVRQAMVPVGATVLPNKNGTAPGLYLPANVSSGLRSPHVFLLPGPPRELQPMFEEFALPILRRLAGELPERECRTYRVVGLGESAVEELIGQELTSVAGLEVGYCARPNEVDFRLIGAPLLLAELEPRVLQALGTCLVSQTGEKLEEWVVAALTRSGLTVATAESCSGGLLAHRLTNVPGASSVFHRGFVTYSNEAKTSELGVPWALLEAHGAVSQPVACAMAEGALRAANADFSLALTGIAGPGGATPEKPVGLVFIALAQKGAPTLCEKKLFSSDRETFKQLATQSALDLLRHALLA